MKFLSLLTRLARALGLAFLRAMLGLLNSLVGLLAESASVPHPHSDGDDELFHYGVFNYRTRKMDDGTDPYGWYNLD